MQYPEKVFRVGALRRIAALPAAHFVLLGSLLFFVSTMRESASDAATDPAIDRVPIEIPASRVAEAEQTFRAERRRPPTVEERAEIVDTLIDEEVLFRHALHLGLQHAEVPRRRLVQIARFVDPPSTPANVAQADAAELARRAIELGLHEGDFVTRRVLIDAARRLIRGAGRLVEPSHQAVDEFLGGHGERFRDEDRFRVSHVLASRSRHDDPTSIATAWLDRLRRDGVGIPAAAPVGDSGLVPPHLPLLGVRAIERRFGRAFAQTLAELPVGAWAGPVSSRHGAHVIFVHEHQPGRVPEATEVADEVRAILREQAADRWLAVRLEQLRASSTVRIGDAKEMTS